MNFRLQRVERTGEGRRHIRSYYSRTDLERLGFSHNTEPAIIISVSVENRTHSFPTGTCKRFAHLGVDNDNRFVCHLTVLYQLKTLFSVDYMKMVKGPYW